LLTRYILQALLICLPASPQLSDKWFFMGAAFRKLEYRQAIQTMQSEFFYLTTNLINDTIELRESQTM
jgi:alpha-1-acid glycoprotein 1